MQHLARSMKNYFLLVAAFAALLWQVEAASEDLTYGYECQEGKCVKKLLSEQNFDEAISLSVCRMLCGGGIGSIWPQPTGHVEVAPLLMHIDVARISYEVPASDKQRVQKLWTDVEARFNAQLQQKIPEHKLLKTGGYALNIKVVVTPNNNNNNKKEQQTDDDNGLPHLTLDTDESYKIVVNSSEGDTVTANVSAENFFGARHGLETLAQLIVYDDLRRELQMLGKVVVNDEPAYKWRGILLDTSRSFYSVPAIKRTLDGMAMVKLNTFHWHITDSHSFPLELKSEPDLYKLGAYSSRKVYTQADVADIVEYGRVRGIRVMPEFDAPAHVGEGWQLKNMTACFRAQPWINYCVEPPCGQLDPTVDALYDVLENIYREMTELFAPDVFHMGGDEVSVKCWNSSVSLQKEMYKRGWKLEEMDFMKLWNEFQTRALQRFDAVSKRNAEVPIVLWTSRLTQLPYIDEFLDKSRYIIQIWTTGTDMQVQQILKRGFRIIVSNYDALYFDCGNAAWVTEGQNWCSPYKGWQRIYDNDLKKIAGDYNSLVLGSEAAVWSEQIDEQNLDSRVWPRASAMAERLWSQPKNGWREAESRILLQRERLVENGIAAEQLQPEWCLQNEGECPIDAYNSKN